MGGSVKFMVTIASTSLTLMVKSNGTTLGMDVPRNDYMY